MFYDLASLAKALVTAPLALEHLDLDIDRREQLGFVGEYFREEPITARQLLSHTSGLPPWLPYDPNKSVPELVQSIQDKMGTHDLLRMGVVGTSVYSDLNYCCLAKLLEQETQQDYETLATKRGLKHQPWMDQPRPTMVPDGPDKETWQIAAPDGLKSYPLREEYLPHDANSRAGMRGHAGFGASREQFRKSLEEWLAGGWAQRQAIETGTNEEGAIWGLGLWQVYDGQGRFGDVLSSLNSLTPGVHIAEDNSTKTGVPITKVPGDLGEPTDWWMHTGFTGPAVFYHAKRNIVVGVLIHRAGPHGELIDIDVKREKLYSCIQSIIP